MTPVSIVTELFYFTLVNARASLFGAFLLVVLMLSALLDTSAGLSRYDVIFICALIYQAIALLSGTEKLREFVVIFLFHIVATVMELFKTHPQIGSWSYPEVEGAFFVIGTVPLFAGFLYSAVGSYISRAIVLMKLSFEQFPRYYHLWILSGLIYLNFFLHHFVFDMRYLILSYVFVLFWKTQIVFTVYKKVHRMPFLIAGLLTAVFIWVAENIGTYTKVWLYPNQLEYWQVVPVEKIGSWFLLLILSFALVSIVYRGRLKEKSNQKV